MYLQGEEGEEEVLWMRVGIWLRTNCSTYPNIHKLFKFGSVSK